MPSAETTAGYLAWYESPLACLPKQPRLVSAHLKSATARPSNRSMTPVPGLHRQAFRHPRPATRRRRHHQSGCPTLTRLGWGSSLQTSRRRANVGSHSSVTTPLTKQSVDFATKSRSKAHPSAPQTALFGAKKGPLLVEGPICLGSLVV